MKSKFLLVWLCGFSLATPGTLAQWKGGEGNWAEAAKWGGAVPPPYSAAYIDGLGAPSDVTFDHGDAFFSDFRIGQARDSTATLSVEGGALTCVGGIDVGDATGSHGRLILKSGRLFGCLVYICGGGGPDRRCQGEFEIQGGSVLANYLELGLCAGSTGALRIVGSKSDGITVMNEILIGVYNYLKLENNPPGSDVAIEFDLDADGVTPVMFCNKGSEVVFPAKEDKSKCRLRVALLDTPPSGDILLVGSLRHCRNTFSDLPEGSLVRAEHAGKSYEWKLTYAGGESKANILLTDAQTVAADGTKTPYKSGKKARDFGCNPAVIRSGFADVFRQQDALEAPLGAGIPAFPGAEGYGAYAKGGRGGKALFVTNLEDSGAGSLREAIETKGPRTVMFQVGGTIALKKPLVVTEPYITIAGQSAPGDGICISGAEIRGEAFTLKDTHDAVIRFLRIRAGHAEGDRRPEAFRAYDSENFIVDHCSCSWGNAETLSTSGYADRYTIQWCIIAEGINENQHAFATLMRGGRCSWHHNLFAHMISRVPRFAALTLKADFRNNVLYDWGHTAGYGDWRSLNYINNYLKPGPSTTQQPPMFITVGTPAFLSNLLYINGNLLEGYPDASRDNWLGVRVDPIARASTPFAAPPVQTQPAEEALALVLQQAGATLPKRDPIDARVVSDVRNKTGKLINRETEVGGWPTYASAQVPLDSNNDGIPDDWKKAHGLPLNDSTVANRVTAEGYTNLEMYLNSLCEKR